MTSRIEFHQNPSHLFPVKDFLKNHQKWEISRKLYYETGSPAFHLLDPYGLSYVVTEFIVEDLDPYIRETLSRLATTEERLSLIHQ